MTTRIIIAAAVLGLGIFALWHPPTPTVVVTDASAVPSSEPTSRTYFGERGRFGNSQPRSSSAPTVVYVAGAVKSPGLYRVASGDRAAKAVSLAGGFTASAEAAGVNLAQHVADGDEVYVPLAGQAPHADHRRGRHHHRKQTPPPDGSVDINRARAPELAALPGIGRAIAARIIELREREGSFTSLDELLDVAGMTQARLERARPYLHEP